MWTVDVSQQLLVSSIRLAFGLSVDHGWLSKRRELEGLEWWTVEPSALVNVQRAGVGRGRFGAVGLADMVQSPTSTVKVAVKTIHLLPQATWVRKTI